MPMNLSKTAQIVTDREKLICLEIEGFQAWIDSKYYLLWHGCVCPIFYNEQPSYWDSVSWIVESQRLNLLTPDHRLVVLNRFKWEGHFNEVESVDVPDHRTARAILLLQDAARTNRSTDAMADEVHEDMKRQGAWPLPAYWDCQGDKAALDWARRNRLTLQSFRDSATNLNSFVSK